MIIISLQIVNGKKIKIKVTLSSTSRPSEPSASLLRELPDTILHAFSYHLSFVHPVTHGLKHCPQFCPSISV